MTTYVDDTNIFGPCEEDIKEAQKELAREFDMKDLGAVSYYLWHEYLLRQ